MTLDSIFMIVMRLIHVVSGVFWAGGTFFFISVIAPTVELAGPEGGRFMQRMAATGRMTARLGVTAALTGITGLIMFIRLYSMGGAAFFQSGSGIVLTLGSLAGLAAWLHGAFAVGALSRRLGQVARDMLASDGPPAPEQLQEAQLLGRKLGRNANIAAGLLLVAVFGMATFQYF
jgi:uncharacterized membrane protein